MNTQPTPDNPKQLNITSDAKPNVPSFACLVYVCHHDDGTVSARVANLAGADAAEIKASANSERDVLGKVVREFKSRVAQLLADEQEIPWIDPPATRDEHEQIRSVPMHL